MFAQEELGYENRESALPTKIRVGSPGEVYVLFESDESIIDSLDSTKDS